MASRALWYEGGTCRRDYLDCGRAYPSDSEQTVNPLFPLEDLDLGRMRRDRRAKLQAAMDRRGIDVLVLAGTGNVHYATGARWAAAELGRSVQEPAIAIVDRAGLPHLFTAYPEGVPPDLPPAHLHGPLAPEIRRGRRFSGRRRP